MQSGKLAILALVSVMGALGVAPEARAAWVDQGTTTSVVTVPDTAIADTVTVTYTELVPSTRVDVRYSTVPEAWIEMPVPSAGSAAATAGGASVYGSARAASTNPVQVDGTKARSALGATSGRVSNPSSSNRGGGAAIR
ncbi:MAG: hypothetical protein VKP72_01305 [bacterium]|nr:hypothetical protein [bacterium]